MTEEELYKYHEDVFKPIYADLVAVLGSKPEQIAFELEAALSHVAVAKTQNELYADNINKAHGHLQRAALDAVKIMWLEYMQRAEHIILDSDIRKFASNASEQKLIIQYQDAEKLAKEARRKELSSTGKNPSEAINLYYQAAQAYSEIIELIDPDKVANLTRLKSKLMKKEIIISFLVGVASSAVVAILFA